MTPVHPSARVAAARRRWAGCRSAAGSGRQEELKLAIDSLSRRHPTPASHLTPASVRAVAG